MSASPTRRAVRATVPIAASVIPFGLVFGAATVEAGYPAAAATGFSVLIFAGAAQLAAMELLADGSAPPIAIATAVVINLRMLMYSASLAPWFSGERRGRRAAAAYLLTDQAYAMSLAEFEAGCAPADRLRFYTATAVTMWTTWQVATVVGAVVGTEVPDDVPLEFAVPLVFLILLVPAISDRPRLVAATAGAAAAVALGGLPANGGLFAGAVVGIAAGALAGGPDDG